MKIEQEIKIDDFDNKYIKSPKYNLIGNEKAVVSHYLHNYNTVVSKHFKKDALTFIKDILNYKNVEEHLSLVEDSAIQHLLFEVENVPFPTPENYRFKFIDLFAGVGGFRIAMQNAGGKCVFTSEWDKEAQKTYKANFGEIPFGDITKEEIKNYIPDNFDVLCAGFPCQAFSIAGQQKGFSDTRGTLFFDLEQIIARHNPKVVFLENVKNLVSHDNGNTFKVILETLENKLGYKVYHKVLNSMTHANVPQNRERIFIVAFNPNKVKNYSQFKFPTEIKLTKSIQNIIDSNKQDDCYYYPTNHRYYSELEKTITSKETIYQWRRIYVRENKSKVCPTLTANMGTGGHNVPLIKDNFGIRKLTPTECFAFQGYPIKEYKLPNISNSRLYMQAGNSVTTNLIERIGNEIIKLI